MYVNYENVAIKAIAAAAPKRVLDNESYAKRVNDRRYKRRILYTGIKQRRCVVGSQRTSDLATIAAERVIKHLQWDKNSIDSLIFVTQSPDMIAPSTAMLIQAKLGLSFNLLAFDVNLGCSGFTTGIQIMAGILRQTKGRGLLLMGDCQHYTPGTEFDSDSILFGDGGAAVAMEYDEQATSIPAFQMTDGNRVNVLCSLGHGRRMDGNALVLFSLNEVVNSINDYFEYFEIDKKQIDWYILHQAQKILVDGIANNCGMPIAKLLKCYEKWGNTSSASIPFALCTNVDKLKEEQLRCFACGYGIGLVWSGITFDIKSSSVIPVIESDYTYPNLLE